MKMTISKRPIILYQCDGSDPRCDKTRCYKGGGECRLTRDPAHAVNFLKAQMRATSPRGNEIIRLAYIESDGGAHGGGSK